MTTKDITVGVIGASGYTGSDLIRLLLSHPKIDLKYVSANNHAGQRINEIFPYLKGNINLLLEKWQDRGLYLPFHANALYQRDRISLSSAGYDVLQSPRHHW